MRLDKKFRVPPVNIRTRDRDRTIVIEHRLGAKGGAFSRKDLFKSTGLEAEFGKTCTKLSGKFRDREIFDNLCHRIHQGEMQKLNNWVSSYKKYLNNFYLGQRLKPLVGFLPYADKRDPVMVIAGFRDLETHAPVAGDLADISLFLESEAIHSKAIHDHYREIVQIAKTLLKLPDVNKDIQGRMSLVIDGEVTKAGLIEYQTRK